MMQPQWPGLGPTYELSSLDGGASDLTISPFRTGGGSPAQQSDAIARPWWCGNTGNGTSGGDPLSNFFGSSNAAGNAPLLGLMSGLIGTIQQLLGAFLNQSPGANQPGTTVPTPAGPQQGFANVDVSSTGDPHIAETGTRDAAGGGQAVDTRWDSMTSHDDLVHSNQIDGGYRVSTAVTQPGANGVTFNQSATVHTNFDQDSVTLNRDGSFAIFDDGQQVQLGKGESATLSGGETVSVNQDGSLKVAADDGRGGTIATTLRSTGTGVDVTAHAHELALGGDAVTHGMRGGGRHRAHGGQQQRVRLTPVFTQQIAPAPTLGNAAP